MAGSESEESMSRVQIRVRLAGPAAVGAGLVLLSATGYPVDSHHWTPIAAVLILLALPGLHSVQEGRNGKLGAAAFLMASGGAFTFALGGALRVFAIFVAHSDFEDLFPQVLEWLPLVYGGLVLAVGLVLFGVTAIRAGVLPRTASALLPLSAVLWVLGALTARKDVVIPPGYRLSEALVTAALTTLAIGLLWLGAVVWIRRGRLNARERIRGPRQLAYSASALVIIAVFSILWLRLSGEPINAKATADRPDDESGPQIHLVYATPSDGRDRFVEMSQAISRSVSRTQEWLKSQTGGRALRFDTHEGKLDTSYIRLTRSSRELSVLEVWATFDMAADLEQRGLGGRDKSWIVFVDSEKIWNCAFAEMNFAFLFLDDSCYGYSGFSSAKRSHRLDFTLVHEAVHTLGHVPRCAPHVSEKDGHVTDDPLDLMSHEGTRILKRFLDSARDDYYAHSNADCPDLADSTFLQTRPAREHRPWWLGREPIVDGGFELSGPQGFEPPWKVDVSGATATIDRDNPRHGRISARLSAADGEDEAEADISQCFVAAKFRGRYVRFGGYLKTESVTSFGASIWASARAWRGASLEYRDTFQEKQGPEGHQHLVGSNDWKEYSERLFIPPMTTSICVGVDLSGSGTVFADDLYIKLW